MTKVDSPSSVPSSVGTLRPAKDNGLKNKGSAMTIDQKVQLEQDKPMPAEHRGMPRRDVQPQAPLVEKYQTQHDTSSETSLRLPHERDQSEAMTGGIDDPIIGQAFADVQNGIKDTSKQPEMLDAYKKLK